MTYGFGTRMICRVMGGEVQLQFEPDGLICTIETPSKGVVRAVGASNVSESAFHLVGNAGVAAIASRSST